MTALRWGPSEMTSRTPTTVLGILRSVTSTDERRPRRTDRRLPLTKTVTRRTCERLTPCRWMRIDRRLRHTALAPAFDRFVTSGMLATAPLHVAPPTDTVCLSGRSRDERPT